MSDMVERVAKVLYLWQEGKNDWDAAEPECKEDAREAARSAIEAMREPTEGMVNAATDLSSCMVNAHEPEFRKAWQDMIDEALK